MQSLLLKKGIITLKDISSVLDNVTSSETIGNMQLIPDGGFNCTDRSHLTINRTLTAGEHSNSFILNKEGNEYPIFYGSNCYSANPVCISYGIKEGKKLILLQEMFLNRTLYSKNPIVFRCSFFDINAGLVYGKAFRELEEKEIFNNSSEEEGFIYPSVEGAIGIKNMEKISKCIDAYEQMFVMRKKY